MSSRLVLRRGKINSRIPCLEHGQEVGVVVSHVLPAHELEHRLVIKVTEDDSRFGQARLFGGFYPVVSESGLVAISYLTGNDPFP